jgi:hypothetical protein
MTAEDKLAHQRLSVLQLAEILGNVTEACRQRDISRTQFYEYKRRFQTHGLEGLKDLPPIHKWHPFTTPPETVEKIVTLSMDHPAWGCDRLSDYLKLQGTNISSPTIQGILIKNGMGSRYERLLKLEERLLEQGIELTPQQAAQIEKANPAFKERALKIAKASMVHFTGDADIFKVTSSSVNGQYFYTVTLAPARTCTCPDHQEARQAPDGLLRSYNASKPCFTRSGVNGICRSRTPVASKMALASAAAVVT